MRKPALLFWVVVGIAVAAGCSQEMHMRPKAAQADLPARAGEAPASAAPVSDAAAPGMAQLQLAANTASPADRYLLKSANISIEMADPAAGLRTLTQAAADRGGYISNLNESVDNLGGRVVVVELRIPAAELDETLLQLDGLGKVLQKSVTAQDVTEEYVDNDARQRNLVKTEERLVEHLGRMGTLDDILKVENELTRVRAQIEQLQGRLRYLDQRVQFSSITCRLVETPDAGPIAPPNSYSSAEQFTAAVRSLVAMLQVVWTAFIWVAVWSPVWVPALAGLVFITRRRRVLPVATVS